jgi:ABC-type antimicrobial peptide transport system permease subunit
LLGGLGVVIGSLGLGFLIIRNLQERRHEMATYFVLGFRKRYILSIVIAEHVLILVSGTVLGILTGLAAILPSLYSPAADIPFGFLSITIAVIFLNGFLWVIIPVWSVFRSNPVQELRKE